MFADPDDEWALKSMLSDAFGGGFDMLGALIDLNICNSADVLLFTQFSFLESVHEELQPCRSSMGHPWFLFLSAILRSIVIRTAYRLGRLHHPQIASPLPWGEIK